MRARIAVVLAVLLAPAIASDSTAPALERDVESRRAIDASVERGLRWLAAHQLPCGGWAGDVGHKQEDDYVLFDRKEDQERHDRGHMGVTALVGLAFLASGHVPDRGAYAATVDRAIDYVLAHMNDYGYLTDSGTRMYSHAFATLFLAEVEGMSRRRGKDVHEALHRATDFIVSTQNAYGAWRYSPFTVESDLSVTVCQVQALRSARNVGIHVPAGVIDRVLAYVRNSRIEGGRYEGAFYYKIHGRSSHTRTSFAINAAAVTTLHCAGVYDESQYGRAVEVIDEEYEAVSSYYPEHFYFWYGNYYAAQAMHHVGGDRFERYFERLAKDLTRRQQGDGRWRNDVGPGDNFATAVACILLRVREPYLPMLQR